MNRLQVAKQMRFQDELIWYQKHQGRMLKCMWRNVTTFLTPPGKVEMTFMAQWMDNDQVRTVFTMEYPK